MPAGAAENARPSIAELVAPLLAQCAEGEDKLLLAAAERVAAARYREWAGQVGDGQRAGMLACSAREETVAAELEALVPGAGELAPEVATRFPDLGEQYRAVLGAHRLDEQFAIQAAAERAGAALLRAYADAASAEDAERLRSMAELEEANAGFLDSVGGGTRPETRADRATRT